ncbi:MAG: hypothetical protein WCF79_02685, partial [Rhodomicrobium sp.]
PINTAVSEAILRLLLVSEKFILHLRRDAQAPLESQASRNKSEGAGRNGCKVDPPGLYGRHQILA